MISCEICGDNHVGGIFGLPVLTEENLGTICVSRMEVKRLYVCDCCKSIIAKTIFDRRKETLGNGYVEH